MTHYDVTVDIPSNDIIECEVIMDGGAKNQCPLYMMSTKCNAQNRDLGMEIPFKTGHSMT